MSLLEIKDLYANAGEKEILKGLNMTVNPGEVHVIMGPNGAGKSTFANVILNNPEYTKKSGTVEFEGERYSLTALAKKLSGKKYAIAGSKFFKLYVSTLHTKF